MKKYISITVFLASAFAFAGGKHYHPVQVVTCPSKECAPAQIEAAVPKAIADLVKWGKIESSWSSAKIESVSKKDFKKGPEWVVTLVDTSIKDPAKQKRYIFITLDGFVNGSNSTGE